MTLPTLREARVRRQMTQDELAVAAEVDQTYISSIEVGRRPGSNEVRERLAKALGFPAVTIRWPKRKTERTYVKAKVRVEVA